MAMSNKQLALGLLLGLGIFGFVWFMSRSSKPAGQIASQPLELRPVGSRRATQYTNTEEWDVQYNQDGLPTKIVVHRKAVQT